MARINVACIGAVWLMSMTAGFADVTPEQVWQAWEKEQEISGSQVDAGSSKRQGDTLVLRDVKLLNSDNNASITITIPELDLRDQGDGTVALIIPPKAAGTVDMLGRPWARFDLTMTPKDLPLIFSGTPEDLISDFDATNMAVEVDFVISPDEEEVPGKLRLSLDNLTRHHEMKSTNGHSIVTSLKAAMVKLNLSGADPDLGITLSFDEQLADLAYDETTYIPEGTSPGQPYKALAAGFRTTIKATHGVGSYKVQTDGAGGPYMVNVTMNSGSVGLDMAQSGVHLALTGKDVALDMTSKDLPFPVSATLSEIDTGFRMPLLKADADQPFKGNLALRGLSLSDTVWGMFDPDGTLARDPATLVVDLGGKMTVNADLLSPEIGKMTTSPTDLKSLDITDLRLSALGADLTGNGALAFDNSTRDASMLMSMPKGGIDLKLVGANALLDKLVTIGLLPQDQATFGRMMLGLYAKPAGDDVLSSHVAFKDDGDILVNGQPVQ